VKRVVADPTKCLACRGCELACALAHAGTTDLVEAIFVRGAKPRIYVEAAHAFAVPLACRHCEDAPCVRVCPSGALGRASEASPVLVVQSKCIGCGFCAEACPFGVIRLARCAEPGLADGQTAVIKCDLCAGQTGEGLGPACVAACPVGALAFEEIDDSARRARAWAAAQLAGRRF